MTISGPSGELLHGYLVAATLGQWRVKGGRLRAVLRSSVHSVYITRRPLDVRLTLGKRAYIWRDVTPQIAGGKLLADVPGSPEVV